MTVPGTSYTDPLYLLSGDGRELAATIEYATGKLASKGADWIVANDVSHGSGIGGKPGGVMGGDHNVVHVVSAAGVESWPELTKSEVAERLVAAVARTLRPNAGKSQ